MEGDLCNEKSNNENSSCDSLVFARRQKLFYSFRACNCNALVVSLRIRLQKWPLKWVLRWHDLMFLKLSGSPWISRLPQK